MCGPIWRNLLRVLLLAAALTLATPAAAQAPSARIDLARDAAGASLALGWPVPVVTEVRQEGRELSLAFSRPLGTPPLESIPERLQGWVDNVLYGYDSLLLVLAEGVSAEVLRNGNGLRIAFSPDRRSRRTEETEAAERAAQRRIDYFTAVTLMDSGEVRQARGLLAGLLARDPADAQSTALLAQAEERLGRWRQAMRLYDRGLELTPDEPSLVAGKARLLHDRGDRLQVDHDLFRVRNADVQRVTRISGVTDLGRAIGGAGSSLLYSLEDRQVDVDVVQRLDGAPAPLHGSRRRAELTLLHDWPELEQSRVSLFLARGTAGAGYSHGWRHEDSETRTGIAWNEPSFAFLEGLVGGGRRDRLFLQHEERLSPRWIVTVGAGYNRYGLAGARDLARSATVEGSVRYILNQEGPLASVAYLLDAEYVGRRAERLNDQGAAFAPLPAATREVHGLQIAIDDQLTDYVRYAVQLGYAYDRRGKSGPQGAVSLGWEPNDNLEVGLRASHAQSTARGTANAVDAAGGYLIWRY
ncbi:tetratricopeptide repeat protein [Azospirillum thermophilum]|uniref:Uncharacterized protein n=1 Tax=Azospirillum thermophilum TaxID=2202148 RepID=A0A2S2CXP4_9PROT|nr:tetratricopeptide repeat protein [Azospirillum thermophilum]AWK89180.1 hypothetical protein DEW08_24695 [Azospirillum thermophilum]